MGSLVSRVAYDSEVVHGLLQQLTGGFLLQLMQVTAVRGMLFTLNPKPALYTLILAPLVVAGSVYFWRRIYPKYYRYWDASSKQAGALSGMLSGNPCRQALRAGATRVRAVSSTPATSYGGRE